MNTLDGAVCNCLQAMKNSSDFSDEATTIAIQELLSCIISRPKELINYPNEENLSLVLSNIMTSSFPSLHPICKGLKVRDVVFVCAYYLYMHQLETGYFHDRNWPAFISLLHVGLTEFAKFSIEMDAFAPERFQEIMGQYIDFNQAIKVASGVELSMMFVAMRKGFQSSDDPWFVDLYEDCECILYGRNPFRSAAIPLYQCISNFLKEDNLPFVRKHQA